MKEYKQISLEKRKELYVMIKNGAEVNVITKAIGRSLSTVKRELKGNTIDERICYLPDEPHRKPLSAKQSTGLR